MAISGVRFIWNSYYTHWFNNNLCIVIVLDSRPIMILAAVSVITGIMIIIQTGSVYAVSSEKIPLVQKYEQFPGQEITGFWVSLWLISS